MKYILLQNGIIVNHDGQFRKDVLIRNKKIFQIDDRIIVNDKYEVIDCAGRLIFPGLIDAHTHMGVPIKDGYSADDFESGTRSALNGGITTIIDFTVLEKDQSLQDSLIKRRKLAQRSIIDYSLHCNVTRFDKNILNEIPKIIKMGVNSFKVFTTYKDAGMMLTYDQISEIASVIADNGGLLMVHAEDNDIVAKASDPLIPNNFTHPKYHAIARPAEAEAVAIENIANITEKTGCKSYIVHLNTAKGLDIAKNCDNMIIETCPQYLLLDESYYERKEGRMFIASPPLRKEEDSEALWNGIIDGSIDVLASDHCPFMLADKPDGIPFQNIPNGIGGVETLFPVMLAQFIQRGIDLSRLSELMSYNPAKIFNLPQKGVILVGLDADLTIVDPDNIQSNWNNKLVSKTDWNAYVEYPAIFPDIVINNKSYSK